MRSLILVTTVLFVASQAAAGAATVRGLGATSCGALSQAFAEHPSPVGVKVDAREYASRSALYNEWLLGYISAFDHLNGATSLPGARESASRLPDSTALTAWVQHWCSDHPLETVSDAAWAFLVGELGLKPRAK